MREQEEEEEELEGEASYGIRFVEWRVYEGGWRCGRERKGVEGEGEALWGQEERHGYRGGE